MSPTSGRISAGTSEFMVSLGHTMEIYGLCLVLKGLGSHKSMYLDQQERDGAIDNKTKS